MRGPALAVTDALGRRVIFLDKPLFTLGNGRARLFSFHRHQPADLCVGDEDASRVHAEVVAKGATFVIRDKKSRFGTFVNAARVTEKVLENGDVIRLGHSGDTDIVFFTDWVPPPRRPGLSGAQLDAGVYEVSFSHRRARSAVDLPAQFRSESDGPCRL